MNKAVPNLIVVVETSGDNDEKSVADDDIWKNYIAFRQALKKIKFPLFIELALKLKANAANDRIIGRWKSESIAHVILDSSCFIKNSKGYIVLPAKHERVLTNLIMLRSSFCFQYEAND